MRGVRLRGRECRALQEFDGPPKHFYLFDKDGDGFLVEFEAPPPPDRGGPHPPVGGPNKGFGH